MLTVINGKIKWVDEESDQKIQLAVSKDDYEKFKEYERSIGSSKFYADFLLDDRQFYVTGFFEVEEEGNTVIMSIASANKDANGRALIVPGDIKALFGLNDEKKEINVQMLKHPRKQVEELKLGVQELEAEVEKLKAIDSTALQQQLEEKNAKITELEALDAVALQQKLTEKENEITALKAQPDAAVTKLEGEKQSLTNKIKGLEAQLSTRPDAAQLTEKDEKIKTLTDEVQKLKAAQNPALLQDKDKQIKTLTDEVQKLTQKNQELEDKSKTTEQPKQGNGAKYTATVGMGLAAGLIAFTALERTVRLEMLVMVGIAVASAIVAGGITYAVLPSTQVDGAKAQEVNENGKGK